MFIVHVTMNEVRILFLVFISSFVAFSGIFISYVAYCVTVYFYFNDLGKAWMIS